MCGIVGYIGEQSATEILLKGLEKLEYRGYDSAGIALLNENGVSVFKEKGKIKALRGVVDHQLTARTGIGHTRWATHGVPNRRNAHPHQSATKRFTIVHNGVIENYQLLQKEYLPDVVLESDTDTEVLVQLVEKFSNEGMSTKEAFRNMLTLLHGSYALAMLDSEDASTIYVAKNKSPLLVGLGESFHVVVSDAMAMMSLTDRYVEIMDEEMVLLKKDQMTIETLLGEKIEKAYYIPEMDNEALEKGDYDHYMLKEIEEQPAVMRKIIKTYTGSDNQVALNEAILQEIHEADRIYILACGTSYHAGLVGKQLLETISRVPTEVHIASEFVCNTPLLSKKPIFLFISQSGETADSRAALVEVSKRGYTSVILTNVPGSTLSREAKYTLPLCAGPEISVASTKAYTAQVAVLSLLAYAVATYKHHPIGFDPLKELAIVANAMEMLCGQKEKIAEMAREYVANTRNAFFIGKGLDYYVSLEAALKLKEISYIQAEGFAGGELKHGTIALIEEGTPVIALVTQEKTNLSIRGNVKEVNARGAKTCVLAMEGLNTPEDAFVLPSVHPILTPLAAIIPLQYLAYYAAVHRGTDVDQPKNLAKSVTVE